MRIFLFLLINGAVSVLSPNVTALGGLQMETLVKQIVNFCLRKDITNPSPSYAICEAVTKVNDFSENTFGYLANESISQAQLDQLIRQLQELENLLYNTQIQDVHNFDDYNNAI